MSEHYLDVVRKVLDRPLIDANHNDCGKVDDIELDLVGEPKIVALLVGNEYASERLPEDVGKVRSGSGEHGKNNRHIAVRS